MTLDFPVQQTVQSRHSVRSYLERTIPTAEKEQIRQYAHSVHAPFSVPVTFYFAEKQPAADGQKLGTYGVIKGSSFFMGASTPSCDLGLEALGYAMEQVILYLTAHGFGTCWLGGTFDRSAFAESMHVKAGELFPAITPIGYARDKRRAVESVMRVLAKADQRQDWSKLFFYGDFAHPLSREQAGSYAFPLEMLRLAPSAVNKQPWRIVQTEKAYHFYAEIPLKEKKPEIEIQRTDVGIGACHFHLAALEQGLSGHFAKLETPQISAPAQTRYLFSWIPESILKERKY